MIELRDYQTQGIAGTFDFLRSADSGARLMQCAPCGTGKSIVEILVQRALGDACWIVTPRTEIIDGMIEKGGNGDRISTPVRLRNMLLRGETTQPRWIIVDEGHHDISDVAEQIRLCCGNAPTVAFTATPFRGTPQGTARLRELYGPPHWMITMKDASARGFLAVPQCKTIPILDDEIVEIKNGEFTVRSIERKTEWQTATELVRDLWLRGSHVPTVVSLPTVRSCDELAQRLGIPTRTVTSETKSDTRRIAFAECCSGVSILLQVRVVSEGIDLPIRRLIDFSPTMSPVRWLQQIGRIMRPGGVSEYVCTNRNLLRHGYLLEGLVPARAFAETQAAFVAPARRIGIRAFGLEGVGRLKPCSVPLANGLKASAYFVTRGTRDDAKGYAATQYIAIVLPDQPEVLWAERTNGWKGEAYDYGKWARCESPEDLVGFASVPPRPLTDRMRAKWKQSAKAFGLDPEADIDSKTYGVLPVLWNTGIRISL